MEGGQKFDAKGELGIGYDNGVGCQAFFELCIGERGSARCVGLHGWLVSLPVPGTNWADWSNAFGREMYLQHALEKLNPQYPSESAD